MRLPRLGATLLLLAVLAGCHDPLTEVVVVVQSDLAVPGEVDGDAVAVNAGSAAPTPNLGASVTAFGTLIAFPISVGFTSAGMTSNFSVTVQLLHGLNAAGGFPAVVASRTVTDIRFVDQATMMLVLPLKRACACEGTSCPAPGNPECDNINQPALERFDPAVAPPSTMMKFPSVTLDPMPARH